MSERVRGRLASVAWISVALCGCPAAERGEPGPAGPPGQNGSDGRDGLNGQNGASGSPCSVSSTGGSVTITCPDATSATLTQYTDADAVAAAKSAGLVDAAGAQAALASTISDLQDQIATLRAQQGLVTFGATSTTVDSLFCGFSPNAFNGDVQFQGLTSYAAVKRVCESGCASPSAHVCEATEVSRSLAVGALVPSTFDPLAGGDPIARADAWFDSFPQQDLSAGTINSCAAWQSTSTGLGANVITRSDAFTQGTPTITPATFDCSVTIPFACCD